MCVWSENCLYVCVELEQSECVYGVRCWEEVVEGRLKSSGSNERV